MESVINRYQLIEVAPHTLLVGGVVPRTSFLLEADVPNCILFKEGKTLHIIDTGATLLFRQALLEGVRRLAPFDNLIIHNSHYHPDHTSNNSIINEIDTNKKHLYMSKITAERSLNYHSFFLKEWEEMSKNFYMLEGLRENRNIVSLYLESLGVKVESHTVTQLFSLLEEIRGIKLFNHLVPFFVAAQAIKAFQPTETSLEQASLYDDLPMKVIKIGQTEWRGWDFNGEVLVLQAGGHAPGGLIYYLPKIKFLFLADETTPIPIWSDMNMENALRNFHNYQQMAEDGKVDFMTNGHGEKIFKGKEEISTFARGLLHIYAVFSDAIKDTLFQSKTGLTIDEIYKVIKQKNIPELQRLFDVQFPVFGPFFKGHILNELRTKAYPYEGIGISRKYFSL